MLQLVVVILIMHQNVISVGLIIQEVLNLLTVVVMVVMTMIIMMIMIITVAVAVVVIWVMAVVIFPVHLIRWKHLV